MFGHFLNAILGAIVWALANIVYYDLKRKGVRNFGRFAAFWVGNPATWITFFAVREGNPDLVDPPADDDEALLAEVWMHRRLDAQRDLERGDAPTEVEREV